MDPKDALHELINRLPSDRVETAREVLAGLCEETDRAAMTAERPIEDVLRDLAAQVPRKEWDNLPPDLTDDVDHYVYGTSRK